MWFDLDIKKLAIQLTPTFLRGKTLVSYLKIVVKPMDDVHYQWKMQRKDNLYILAHNGQKCYLRAVINDHFDSELRRIKIDDGNLHDSVYIYTDAEINEQPSLASFFDFHLYQDSDLSDTAVDFYVRVPADIQYNEYLMTYLIDFYKIASKRYKITTI